MSVVSLPVATRRRFMATLGVVAGTLGIFGTGAIKSAYAQSTEVVVYRVDIGQRDSILTTSPTEVADTIANYGGTTVTKLGVGSSVSGGIYTKPIYRLTHNTNGHHYATVDTTEKNNLVASGNYTLEGIIGYARTSTFGLGPAIYINRFYDLSKDLHYFAGNTFGLTPSSTTTYTVNDLYVSKPNNPLSNVSDAILPAGTYYATGQTFILSDIPTP